jgi:hypothetical protein
VEGGRRTASKRIADMLEGAWGGTSRHIDQQATAAKQLDWSTIFDDVVELISFDQAF